MLVCPIGVSYKMGELNRVSYEKEKKRKGLPAPSPFFPTHASRRHLCYWPARLNHSLLPSAVAVLPHASRRHLCRRLASPQPLPSSFPPFLPQQPHTLCAVFPFSSLIYRWHFCCCLISPPSSVAAFAAAPSPFASAASAVITAGHSSH
ncbi:hypothetical protein BHM03_00016624 [Ensete ventricosum]|nr:hypothetical protein BHM03_00016624 [Ensete ventricosum]